MTDIEAPAGAFTTDFAAEFPSTEAQWRQAAEAALKGRPLDPIIRGKLLDGVAFDAIRMRRAAQPIAGRAAGARWTAMTRIDEADAATANAQALEDLNNGASGLSLTIAAGAGGPGLPLGALESALDGVLLDLAPLHIDAAPFEGPAAAAAIAALVEARGLKACEVAVLFGLDPIRDLLTAGGAPKSWDEIAAETQGALTDLKGRGFTSPLLVSDQRLAHEAGASEALELAGALATAVEFVRLFPDAGAETVVDSTALAFSVDANQFAGIAKLRAARLLWAALRRELGLADKPVHIHAETSRRMMTRNDAQTNIVRSTIAAFAAGVGGADSVVTLPFTAAFGVAGADARRIARNTQGIVLEETNAYRVADPSAGAGAIEDLTDALATRAWALFQEIEGLGGKLAAVKSGDWQKLVAKARDARDRDVATRKTAVVGVSQFPKADEVPAASVAEAPPPPAPTGGDLSVEPLTPRRVAEPFEALRAANEAKSPKPAVFLALAGPIARHAARAGFMRNLLEAGGLGVVDGPIGGDAAAAAKAFQSSAASIAVVTGADADYAEEGAALAKALKGAGATVWLAGRPKDGVAELEAAGVSRFVAAGDDALEILNAASTGNGGAA
ncbi:methylmalonyl-CoA mutase family protein [Methylopila sp. M107]|uniref:methylmalonyl-CoA mutase family protein n=1 Tax=Methylopila sp. M107 TaxID=1101190 RepID=UPI00036B1D41|nr:methylmalonyl-CoA mutase family protein [Methylopila sp. M107]